MTTSKFYKDEYGVYQFRTGIIQCDGTEYNVKVSRKASKWLVRLPDFRYAGQKHFQYLSIEKTQGVIDALEMALEWIDIQSEKDTVR
jgi:hypothetical protein